MTLSDVFQGLGAERFSVILRSISKGALRTYQVYDSFKIRAHLTKVNRESLRKAEPKLWARIADGDEALAAEVAHAALVSNLDMVVDVLDALEIPHDGNGFFNKDEAAGERLTEGWRERVFESFREKYSEPLLLLYINHLDHELGAPKTPFLG